ncbi:MAG: hypothetical protein ABI185_02585 [Ginsengibacter sp.]
MKLKYIIFPCVVAVLTSCSSSYHTGQTPDDVYYSPSPSAGPSQNSYVNTVSDQERDSYAYNNNGGVPAGSDGQSQDDNYYVTYDLGDGYSPYGYNALNYNPYLFNSYGMGSSFYGYDPLGYMNFFNPFSFNYYGYSGLMGYYNPYSFYNPYSMYSNPYYGHSSSVTFANSNTYRPRTYNLNAYTNRRESNTGITNTSPSPIRRNSGVGNVIRRVFTPNRNNSNYYTPTNGNRSYDNSNNNRSYNNSNNTRTFNTEQAPSRTYNSSPSISTPSSDGGSAPVRTFRR